MDAKEILMDKIHHQIYLLVYMVRIIRKIKDENGVQLFQTVNTYEDDTPIFSKSFDELVDKTYVINLDERVDRWNTVEKELKKAGISNYERFSAIKPNDELFNEHSEFLKDRYLIPKLQMRAESYKKGALGCLLSHYYVIKDAKEKNYDSVMILEDDVIFKRSMQHVKNSMEQLGKNNFDILYLSGNHYRKCNKVKENAMSVSKTYTTHSYIINKRVYDIILNNILKCNTEIDHYYVTEIQSKGQCYCVYPHITTQNNTFSDIQGDIARYDRLLIERI